MKLANILLCYPLSLIYALSIWIRNKLYDWHIFKSVEFKLPVITVGNITVGGTGKTPHTELLISILKDKTPTAIVSRGYKRMTRGFRYVEITDTVKQAGDEPLQIKRKNPDITVAVDGNRVEAIRRLKNEIPELGVVILDDAFQHRKVHPAISIVLIDYNRPISTDHYLPYGRLRDNKSQKKRADMVIVTKCPLKMQPVEQKIMMKNLKLHPCQQVYFTTFDYGLPLPVFEGAQFLSTAVKEAVILTGIANPSTFLDYIASSFNVIDHLRFPDHHFFTKKDIEKINKSGMTHPSVMIFTTEKDAQRLRMLDELSDEVKKRLFYIPVNVIFLPSSDGATFTELITGYVQANERNNILHHR
jgi:tetraacyldisaccharide 4'-kinase